jgi:serine/threonine protein phosphatase PrpC
MTHQIKKRIVLFSMPKPLENDEDNQDAYCWNEKGNIVAIADGASSSYESKEWANLLVQHFCDDESSIDKINANQQEWLKEPQGKWEDFSRAIQSSPSTTWNQKISDTRDHACATFVGIKIEPPDGKNQGTCHAATVGDSCLFHICITGNEAKLKAIPLDNSKAFNTLPPVVRSLTTKPSSPIKVHAILKYQKNDFFLLATDALAKWILQSYENGDKKWLKLLDVNEKEEFYLFIEKIRSVRSSPKIDIDDTTLCVIRPDLIENYSKNLADASKVDPPQHSLSTENVSELENSIAPNLPKSESKSVNDTTQSKGTKAIKDSTKKTGNSKFNLFNLDVETRRFIFLAFIVVLCSIPSLLNLCINLLASGWISSIFGVSKSNSGATSEPFNREAGRGRVTSIEGIPVFKSDAGTSSPPVGFLFNSTNNGNENPLQEIEVFIPTPVEYIDSINVNNILLKNSQVLPICKSAPLPTASKPIDSCKENIGYILPNSSLSIESPTSPYTIYTNGRVVRAKLRIQK